MKTGMLRKTWAAGLAGVMALSASAFGQAASERPGAGGVKTVFVAEHAGLGAMLQDEKDKALARALSMVPARIRELAYECPDFPAEAPMAINSVLESLSLPGRVAVTFTDKDSGDASLLYGYGIIVSAGMADQARAHEFDALLQGHMKESHPSLHIQASHRHPGMSDLTTVVGPVTFGPRRVGGSWRYEMYVGTVNDPDAPFARWERIGGEGAVFRARFDADGLEMLVDLAESMAGHRAGAEVTEALASIREMKLVGAGAPAVDMTITHEKYGLRAVTVATGISGYKAELGMRDIPLDLDVLNMVPPGANLAWAVTGSARNLEQALADLREESNYNIRYCLDEIDRTMGEGFLEEMLGSLGDSCVTYTSMETGGGGLMSAVMMMEIEDRATLSDSLERLRARANVKIATSPDAGRYVRIVPWKRGDQELVSLRFNGLPVPLEMTFMLTDRWLIAGPTPQGVLAAAKEPGRSRSGQPWSSEVEAMLPEGASAISVSYMDTAWYVRPGYALTQMLGSAIANAVRSPIDPGRDPGMIVPMYSELARNARPAIEVMYWDGDDLVIESRSDGSVLVNTAASAGLLGQFMPAMVALGAAIAGEQQQHNLGRMRGWDTHDDDAEWIEYE